MTGEELVEDYTGRECQVCEEPLVVGSLHEMLCEVDCDGCAPKAHQKLATAMEEVEAKAKKWDDFQALVAKIKLESDLDGMHRIVGFQCFKGADVMPIVVWHQEQAEKNRELGELVTRMSELLKKHKTDSIDLICCDAGFNVIASSECGCCDPDDCENLCNRSRIYSLIDIGKGFPKEPKDALAEALK